MTDAPDEGRLLSRFLRLIEPPEGLSNGRRRRARVGAAILLALAVTAVVFLSLSVLSSPADVWGVQLWISLVAAAAYFPAYWLTRVGAHQPGVTIAVLVTWAAAWMLWLSEPGGPLDDALLYFLALPILLSALLLSVRSTALLSVGTVALVLFVLPWLHDERGLGSEPQGLDILVPFLVFVAVLAIVSSIVSTRDILQLEAQAVGLADGNRQLQETERRRLEFINTVAHDMATPLTPIQVQMHLLATGKGDAGRSMAILRRSVDHLQRMVEDLKDLARLEAGKLTLRMAAVDLSAWLPRAAEPFQETARDAGITLEVHAAPGATVRGDEARLTQVLYNLLTNALKFTPEGGHVTVGLQAGAGLAVLSVADTGRGLTQDERERLFRPFVQVHEDTAHKGSGLGLYISKGIVEAHGGAIAVDSAGEGQGATFIVTLPTAAADEEE